MSHRKGRIVPRSRPGSSSTTSPFFTVYPRPVTKQYTLKINHISSYISERDIRIEYMKFGNIDSVKIISEPTGTYAYVNFTDEQSALQAHKHTNGKSILGSPAVSVVCKWEGVNKPSEQQQTQFTLKVTNLSPSLSQSEMETLCKDYADYKSLKVNTGGYAYVNFVSRDGAEKAMKHLNKISIYGQTPIAKFHNMTNETSTSHHHPPYRHLPHYHPSSHHPPPYRNPLPYHSPSHHPPPHYPSPPRFHPYPSPPISSATVKVSIASDGLTVEDLEAYFSQFGEILQKIAIKQGSPNYSFIYFKTNEAAITACGGGRILLKGVELNMKLSNKTIETVDSQDVKVIKYENDTLVSQILTTCMLDELKGQIINVSLTPSKDGKGVLLSGSENDVQVATTLINLRMEILSAQLTSEIHHLHCQFIPLLEEPSLFQEIEKKHSVELTVVTSSGSSKSLLNLSSMLASLSSSSYPMTKESISEYLTPSAPDDPSSQVIWEYIDDTDSFTAMSDKDSAAVEKLYQSRSSSSSHSIGKWLYRYDFIRNTQTNTSTSRVRQIRRIATSSALSLQIKCRGLPEKVKLSLDDLRESLERFITEKTLSNCSNDEMKDPLIELACTFCVKIDTSYDDKIVVTGANEYLAKVLLILTEKQGRLKSAASSHSLSTSFPPEWENSDSNLELKRVSKGSQEWLNIETKIKETMPFVNITKIKRIQNKFLYTKYDLCKKRMAEKNNGMINEKMLFHGTRETTPDTIYKSEHGFDFRYGGNGMWGKGAYFAVNASYSKNYAYNRHGAGKQMFMAFVLTGITTFTPSNPSLVVPPNNEATGLPYDSVTGHSGSSQIYIVYDHDKSYPAYLITFQ